MNTYEEGSGVVEEHRSPISSNKVFTVSPIREEGGANAMSFTQRDINDEHSSSILMGANTQNGTKDFGSGTAGFHRHHHH